MWHVYVHLWFCVCCVERIENFPANLSESDVREAISNALHVWSDVSRLTFHELPQSSASAADINIQFITGFHDDGYPFDGPGTAL